MKIYRGIVTFVMNFDFLLLPLVYIVQFVLGNSKQPPPLPSCKFVLYKNLPLLSLTGDLKRVLNAFLYAFHKNLLKHEMSFSLHLIIFVFKTLQTSKISYACWILSKIHVRNTFETSLSLKLHIINRYETSWKYL